MVGTKLIELLIETANGWDVGIAFRSVLSHNHVMDIRDMESMTVKKVNEVFPRIDDNANTLPKNKISSRWIYLKVVAIFLSHRPIH